MTDGVKLLQELKSGSYQAAVLASYNVNFQFFEEVVLRALRSRGCDHNVLLMDAGQCASALTDLELSPRAAGRHYSLVPVAAPGAFHPKFVLLLGKRQSKVLVGSHNLTLSGFGINREISNVLTIDDRRTEALARAVFRFALEWAQAAAPGLAELVDAMRGWAPWLGASGRDPEDVVVLGTVPSGPSLWSQLRPRLDDQVVRVTVVGPYFDERLAFLQKLRMDFPKAEVIVAISPEHSEIAPAVALRLAGAHFKDIDGWNEANKRSVHAKLLLFDFANGESLLVSGSANPSAPAWLDGERRNAELVVARRLPAGSSVAADLSLRAIHQLPDMTESSWTRILERRRSEPRTPAPPTRAWIAVATERGFSLDAAFVGPDEPVQVLDHRGDVIAEERERPDGQAGRLVPVTDEDLQRTATIVRARDRAEHLALVHHLAALRDRAMSERRRSLRKALLDLDSGQDEVDAYLTIIEKAIFEEEPAPRVLQIRAAPSDHQLSEVAGSVGVGELEKKGRRKPRLSTGDIGLILDALIARLGEGSAGENVATAARGSEEALHDESETPSLPPPLEEGRLQAERCRKKTRQLMRRVLRRLELGHAEEAPSFAVLVQLTASLGLLHRLRQLQHRYEWLPPGEELVESDGLWEIFTEAAVVVLAPDTGLVSSLSEEFGDFAELTSATALILWAAWTTGLDLTTSIARPKFGEEPDLEEQEANLIGVGLLLNCLRRDFLPPTPELEYIFGEEGLAWLERHLEWAEDVTTAPSSRAPVLPGSVVQFYRQKGNDVGVVVATGERKVTVVDRRTGETRAYAVGAVERVGAVC